MRMQSDIITDLVCRVESGRVCIVRIEFVCGVKMWEARRREACESAKLVQEVGCPSDAQ
jgi:hypothetical protein